jgi:hypothetical protein
MCRSGSDQVPHRAALVGMAAHTQPCATANSDGRSTHAHPCYIRDRKLSVERRGSTSMLMASIRWLRAGTTWVLWTVLAGLLPLWIRVIGVHVHVFPDMGWTQVLKDGMLLYFSIAIVAAITTDYHLLGEHYPKYAHIYMMELFPTILWIGSVIIYFLIWSSQLDEVGYKSALYIEISILISSCIYALIHKAIQITRTERS